MGKKAISPKSNRERSAEKSMASHDENHVDGCDINFRESEPTPDDELPPARGGVEVARAMRARNVVAGRHRRTRR
jgi:hypothetical protein